MTAFLAQGNRLAGTRNIGDSQNWTYQTVDFLPEPVFVRRILQLGVAHFHLLFLRISYVDEGATTAGFCETRAGFLRNRTRGPETGCDFQKITLLACSLVS